MTREKSVSEAAEAHYRKNDRRPYVDRIQTYDFISGARWSDANPLPCPKCAKLLERVERLRNGLLKYCNMGNNFNGKEANRALDADDKHAASMGEK